MMPSAPEAPYFDTGRGAWVLTRFADVMAAFRDHRLWPVAARGEDQSKTRDEAGRLRLRPAVQESLNAAQVSMWQTRAEALARSAFEGLPTDRPVDLLADFALPWCLDLAMMVLDRPSGDRDLLSRLGTQVFAATGVRDDSPLRAAAAEATAELERIFEKGPMPMGEPTFVALSQTTPRLLASIWLALYDHPSEVSRLRAEPSLMTGAVEEFLRFAGIVRRVWRQAIEDVELGGVRVEAGQRLMLMLASANRDPAQFDNPNRLDVTRRVTGQMALGSGRNSCVGAVLVRLAIASATAALIEQFPEAELCGSPEWRTGSGYCFPEAVMVRLRNVSRETVFT